jgi:hypothetical protein
MADFLASPGFVTCTVAAAHDGSADALLAFTGVGQREPRFVEVRVWRLAGVGLVRHKGIMTSHEGFSRIFS